ncbi:MAG: NTP transferase domain-containing protein [archaeon]|nr:NTP transferase domain-containing protein [archaeon]
MEALVMAGGKGTRMAGLNVEKPMIEIGGMCAVGRVIKALRGARMVDEILVAVSPNTPSTEIYLNRLGIKTVKTSGEDYVGDLHKSFSKLRGDYVLGLPSDIPLIKSRTIDYFIEYFNRNKNDSVVAIIEEDTVIEAGFKPSYSFEMNGKRWVISGMSIMNRKRLLDDEVLSCDYFVLNQIDLAINVNTQRELEVADLFLR